MSELEFYSVNYRKTNEYEGEDDYSVLSVDFSKEEEAMKFYNTIVEGNECGEGFYVECLCYMDNAVAVMGRYEW